MTTTPTSPRIAEPPRFVADTATRRAFHRRRRAGIRRNAAAALAVAACLLAVSITITGGTHAVDWTAKALAMATSLAIYAGWQHYRHRRQLPNRHQPKHRG